MSHTPTTEDVDAECEKPTPVKAAVQATYDFCKAEGIKGKNEAIFRFNNVTHATGYRMIAASNPPRLHNDRIKNETRGRKTVVTPAHIREMERIIEEEGIEARALTWAQLGYEVGLQAVIDGEGKMTGY